MQVIRNLPAIQFCIAFCFILSFNITKGDVSLQSFIDFDTVSKIYKIGDIETRALNEVSFGINEGEFCVIVGPSGAGKTTLLNLLGGMDSLSLGQIHIGDQNISKYTAKQLTLYRRHSVGFVFQHYNLVANLTARENIELATEISDDPLDPLAMLERVGLSHRISNFPAQMSGGEQQRVSIARALAKNPKLLLCDEPTGALDDNTGRSILRLLQETSLSQGMTVIIVTHNQMITQMAQRVITVRSGQIHSIIENPYPKMVDEISW